MEFSKRLKGEKKFIGVSEREKYGELDENRGDTCCCWNVMQTSYKTKKIGRLNKSNYKFKKFHSNRQDLFYM